MKFSKHLLATAVAASFMVPMTASATNGYFSIAYGAKSRGVAGASTALPQDTYAAAVNPAGMAQAAGTADFGILLFNPEREATANFGGASSKANSELNGFIIPSGGYVRRINDKVTAGITVYANGGLNTSYRGNTSPTLAGPNTGSLFGFPDRLGVDLAQLVFAPTLTYEINKNHTIGISPLIAYQQFKAYGLQNFCSLKGDNSCNPITGAGIGTAAANEGLTNQGYDTSWGVGLRVGWLGTFDNVSIGAAYSTKIYADEFDKYDQLFAEQGDFDIPANWSIGIAGKISPKVTLTADIQYIDYSDVDSIANDGPSLTGANPRGNGQGVLGSNNGLGFGWESITAVKIGAVYEHDQNFTYRFGLNHADSPIPDDQLAFNVLATAVVEDHLTAGFTYRPNGKDDNEITFTYAHAFERSQSGAFPVAFGGGRTQIQMVQNAFDFAYTWKF